MQEVDTVSESKTLLALYNAATEEPFSFLYVELTSNDDDEMFYKVFDHKLMIMQEGTGKRKSFDNY